jgi:hypothetical protein
VSALFDEAFETVLDSENFHAVIVNRGFRHRADHRIQAGAISPGRENTDSFQRASFHDNDFNANIRLLEKQNENSESDFREKLFLIF